MSASDLNAVVAERIDIAPGLMILRVRPDGWQLPSFHAGQYVAIGLLGSAPRVVSAEPEETPPPPDRLLKRAYSIASHSQSPDYLEFFVTLVHSGAFTPRLFALKPGDRLWLHHKITGMFTLNDVPADKHLVFIGTGTGLAPYMSMLRSGLGCGGRRLAILLGARHSWDLGYQNDVLAWQRECPMLTYLPIVSRPNEESTPWPGFTGHVQKLWLEGHLDEAWGFHPTPDNSRVFLCGNPTMVDDMVRILGAEGFSEQTRRAPGSIIVERYW